MSIFDILVFLLIIVALHLFKARFDNFLFFCKGAILFLPPDEKPLEKSKAKTKPKEKEGFEITIVRIQYSQVKGFQLCNDYDRVSIVLMAIPIFLVTKILIVKVFGLDRLLFPAASQEASNFFFFVCLLSFVYAIKIGLQIFWVLSYGVKLCIIVSLGVNSIFFLLYFGLESLGIYDRRIIMHTADFVRHLQVLMCKQIRFISHYSVLGSVLLFNFFLTLVIIPSVIKFGNWYTETVRRVDFQQEDETLKPQQKQIQKAERHKGKVTIRWLNLYLFLTLVLLVLSHRFLLHYLDERVVDALRAILLLFCVGINCLTLKDAIEFNASPASQYVQLFFRSTNQDERRQLKNRISLLVRLIWYHIFQVMFRAIIPMFIFSILIDWKYLFPQLNSYSSASAIQSSNFYPFSSQPKLDSMINFDTECGVVSDPITTIESIYRCSAESLKSQNIESIFANGKVLFDFEHTGLEKIQKRVNQFGMTWQPLMAQCLQLLFWYFTASMYGLTVVYILFLRKTVYDI